MTFQSVYGSYSQNKAWLLHVSLAARHLESGGLVLYDLSSSYFEGKTCPLAALGHNHDGKKGKLQVNYGLLTDRRGR
jgi:transposase